MTEERESMDQVEVLIETDGTVATFANEADADAWGLTGSPDPVAVREASALEMSDVQQMTAMVAATLPVTPHIYGA